MRLATQPEISLLLDWAAAEGWNPGLDDAAAFHAADPAGFFVAERGGAPVAAISVVNHSDSFAFLGLYLCRPEWRGQGIGYALWQHALAHAGDRTVGLDGVAAQEANYARSGFVRTGATLRMEGSLQHSGPVPVSADDVETLVRRDSQVNGLSRPAFARAWFGGAPSRKTLRAPAGEGFATVRRCRAHCKVGPLVAPDTAAAMGLIAQAQTTMGTGQVIVDVPEAQTDLLGALETAGFVSSFATARMYRGAPPQAHPDLKGIATMELG